MASRSIYYVTNRKHKGSDRFRPKGYGAEPSGDGIENLRFGKATVEVDEPRIAKAMSRETSCGPGDGNDLVAYFTRLAGKATLRAYAEKIPSTEHPDFVQPEAKLGSTEMFTEARKAMIGGRDVLIFVHGYNVSWKAAVGSALGLQEMLCQVARAEGRRDVMVVLFSWPSDGSMMPWAAYKSDRTDARSSGYALGRALLKLRDYLGSLQKSEFCWANINLLCHSMGNFVLQNAVERALEYAGGGRLPRLFDQIFLCSADVDDNVFSEGGAFSKLPDFTREVSIYTNRGDMALYVSDYTKGNPKRLGAAGVARPAQLHASVNQIDCSNVVTGLVEHSYYLDGDLARDIRMSLDGLPQDDARRPRAIRAQTNIWTAVIVGHVPGAPG